MLVNKSGFNALFALVSLSLAFAACKQESQSSSSKSQSKDIAAAQNDDTKRREPQYRELSCGDQFRVYQKDGEMRFSYTKKKEGKNVSLDGSATEWRKVKSTGYVPDNWIFKYYLHDNLQAKSDENDWKLFRISIAAPDFEDPSKITTTSTKIETWQDIGSGQPITQDIPCTFVKK